MGGKILKQTDLQKVKSVAVTLLMTDIHETEYSPMVVQHPFTSSGTVGVRKDGGFQVIDITENEENLRLWREQIKEQIKEADNAFDIYMLLNKPYALTFLKFAEPYLSREDMSKILSCAWVMSENPNADANMNKRQLLSLFRSADPSVLMDEDERRELDSLPSTVTVYRGVTPYNEKNVKALSWTLNYETAIWFATRFGECGSVYKAQVNKENILAFFKGRNEAEVIIDPRHLMDLEQMDSPRMDMEMTLT